MTIVTEEHAMVWLHAVFAHVSRLLTVELTRIVVDLKARFTLCHSKSDKFKSDFSVLSYNRKL